MKRVLALQILFEFTEGEVEPVEGGSTRSQICSVQSSGAGGSSCSNSCGTAAEFDW
jgi:hypothetical protein